MNYKKLTVGAIVLGMSMLIVQAQDNLIPAKPQSLFPESTQVTSDICHEDSAALVSDDSIYIPESLDEDVDKLLQSWHVNYYTKRDSKCLDFDHNIDPEDTVYVNRLSRLPHIIEMPFNDPVRNCIKLYTERRRQQLQYMLGLADFYFPMIEQILDEYDLPLELKYLAVVESALNPTALSRAGACGLWQFILPTGKIYGLEINSLVDERRNPVKATYAACRYLKDMYEAYGDWNLVIASYNCGPGSVNKAIRRAGGVKDYWAIYEYLPPETRSYVPLFIAATYAMNYHNEHNICPIATTMPLSTDTIMVERPLHLGQVAQVLNVDIEQLRLLNPEFKKDIVPGEYKAYYLKLPTKLAYAFIDLQDSIYAYNASQYFPNRTYAGPGSSYLANNSSNKRIVHKVQRGESLLKIANNYGVTVTQIKKWNGLRSTTVSSGKRLTLYVDNGGYSAVSANSSSPPGTDEKKLMVETKASPPNETIKPASAVPKIQSAGNSDTYHKYKVKRGDTFYSIAKKYPGLDAKDIMKANNVKSSGLRVGQIIKIPVG